MVTCPVHNGRYSTSSVLDLVALRIVVGNSKRNLGVSYLFERKCFSEDSYTLVYYGTP